MCEDKWEAKLPRLPV